MKINKLWNWLFNPPLDGPSGIILLRLMAGGVFLWEGMLKFIYVNQGVGRFTKLGLPFPQATANMVGVLEIVGGILLITGFLTRAIVFGNFSFAAASGPPPDWTVGSFTRSTLGVRTVNDYLLLSPCRPGGLVS